MLLAGKVALVTGASRGIGRGIALEMAREGADVVVNYSRSDIKAGKVARDIQALGRRSSSVKADVSSPGQVQAMRKRVLREFGGVDILVNNAGVHHHLKSWEIEDAEWRHVLGVNLDGVFYCSRAFSQEMRTKKWGRIINISSIIAFTGTDHEAHYGTSKAAVVGLTKSLALELAGHNITVNAIAPGWIETDMTSGMTSGEKKKALELVPLRRMGQPEDIAHVAAFLASDKASFITGQTIHVNGGEALL
ncbi:MAG TPA: 3-oxoacyl-ACP reductase family protein [Candidatus Acidoferrum sp.]|nr:3-oxoacyl-ACP reductase family protein [Candidatus Acidoferrum sp.]